MDFATLYNNLVQSFSGILNSWGNEISAVAMGLALAFTLIRIANEGWKGGYDKIMPFIKDQVTKFFIVCALCIPLDVGPLQGSFLVAFPRVVMTAGFETAKTMVQHSETWHSETLVALPKGLDEKIDKIRAAKDAELMKQRGIMTRLLRMVKEALVISFMDFFNMFAHLRTLAVVGILVIMLLPVFIGLIMLGGEGGWIASAVILAYLFMKIGAWATGTESPQIDLTVHETMTWATNKIANFAFIGISSFTFFGVMISATVQSVIHTLLFPFSVMNMAFETRRQIFMNHIAKMFQLALTPVIACLIFMVSAESFALLSAKSGLIEVMRSVYVGDMPATDADFFVVVGWFFRFCVAALISPMVLAMPVATLIKQSSRFAGEVVGQGFAMVNNFQQWSSIGSNPMPMPGKK
ncbi:MAG: hypothetical protein AB1553_04565 [Nitrospirota bacterium]